MKIITIHQFDDKRNGKYLNVYTGLSTNITSSK